jgi:hypothetical protein
MENKFLRERSTLKEKLKHYVEKLEEEQALHIQSKQRTKDTL